MQATILPDVVMPGLVPGIHVFSAVNQEDVDGRDIGERKRRRPSDGYARPRRIAQRSANIQLYDH
jgi:hypothetical protein